MKKLPDANNWNRFWYRHKVNIEEISWSKKRIIKILERYTINAETVLDAGCGSGFFSKYFCDRGLRTWALDYSEEALSLTSKITGGRANILKQDLLSSSLACSISERFDIIFSDGLFEHFSAGDRMRIMKNFYSLLSDKGIIITFVPNKWSPWQIIRPFYMPGIEESPLVLRELVKLNRDNGLKILESGGINTFPSAFSPDCVVGKSFGMLIYTVASK